MEQSGTLKLKTNHTNPMVSPTPIESSTGIDEQEVLANMREAYDTFKRLENQLKSSKNMGVQFEEKMKKGLDDGDGQIGVCSKQRINGKHDDQILEASELKQSNGSVGRMGACPSVEK